MHIPWWRHQMETFSALLAICAGNSPIPGEFPTQRPVTRSSDVYFDLRPNKRLNKQTWGHHGHYDVFVMQKCCYCHMTYGLHIYQLFIHILENEDFDSLKSGKTYLFLHSIHQEYRERLIIHILTRIATNVRHFWMKPPLPPFEFQCLIHLQFGEMIIRSI